MREKRFSSRRPDAALTGDRKQKNGLDDQYEVRRKIKSDLEQFIRGTQACQKERAEPEPFRRAVCQKGGSQPVEPVARRKGPVEPMVDRTDLERPGKTGESAALHKNHNLPF